MKQLYLILSILLLSTISTSAQNNYYIVGKVTGEKQQPLAGAVVFVDGSQIITVTDNTGKFSINVPGPGAYHMSVNMLGYAPGNKDVLLTDRSASLDFTLTVKPILLDEVKIGTDRNWESNFAPFKAQFLGPSPNARDCKIINPEVLSFHFEKNILIADASDFIIIENPDLGYRIKYLLKTFRLSKTFTVKIIHVETSYDGDVTFEELPGTDAQKQQWAKNRLQAYKGSMMHFMRSIFTNTTLQEGFIVNQITPKDGEAPYDDSRLIKFDTLITAKNASFITFRSTGLHVTYNRHEAAQILVRKNKPVDKEDLADDTDAIKHTSNLLTGIKEITVDAVGRILTGYVPSFLISGDWSDHRVADQLPFEYQPPAKPTSKL